MKRVLIVGFGSIGRRHAENFRAEGCDVRLVSRQSGLNFHTYGSVSVALPDFLPHIVFVCTETFAHRHCLEELTASGYTGQIVVEKPLFDLPNSKQPTPSFISADIRVSYNLRFHPYLQRLKEELSGEDICSVTCYVGQYLPTWRPHVNYRDSYSASTRRGGGVILDLSHEIDLCLWMFGEEKGVFARGGKFSDLEIETEDNVAIILEQAGSPLTQIQLNYSDRIVNRFFIVNTSRKTIKLDLIRRVYEINNQTVDFSSEKIDTYKAMTENILKSQGNNLASYVEGMDVMRVAEKIYASMVSEKWVK